MLGALFAVIGVALGFGANYAYTKQKMGSAEDKAMKELEAAKKEASKIKNEAKDEASKFLDEARKEEQTRRKEIKSIETSS